MIRKNSQEDGIGFSAAWMVVWVVLCALGVLCLIGSLGCSDSRISYISNPKPGSVKIITTHVDTSEFVKFDTLPGRVTYIDTAISSPNWKGDKIMWMKGYEVITSDSYATIHVKFLDENKEPFKYLGLGLIR